MLAIGTADQALRRAALEAPGGFLWWYLDLVSPSGDGLVLIWSFGLPFLPGRESAAKRGTALPGREQPSIAVSVYRGGRPSFYLLHAVDASEATVDLASGRVTMGKSTFHSRVEGGMRCVDVHLDLPVPRSPRLHGSVQLSGHPLRVPGGAEGQEHVWSPLTTGCEGRATLMSGDTSMLDLRGRAYHDANGSTRPLASLGIHEWAWGREANGDLDEVHYVLWPEGGEAPTAHLLRLHGDGAVDVEEAAVGETRRGLGWFGLPWHRRLDLRGHSGRLREVRPGPVVDDGPFYLRSLLGQGMAEWVRPQRVDAWWSRPFVRMCVQRSTSNSFLLPFFAGDRATRWRRVLGGQPLALDGGPS